MWVFVHNGCLCICSVVIGVKKQKVSVWSGVSLSLWCVCLLMHCVFPFVIWVKGLVFKVVFSLSLSLSHACVFICVQYCLLSVDWVERSVMFLSVSVCLVCLSVCLCLILVFMHCIVFWFKWNEKVTVNENVGYFLIWEQVHVCFSVTYSESSEHWVNISDGI